MYILKKLGVAVLFLLLLSLLIAPVGMLYLISKEEQKQYLVKPVPVVEELAYGEIVPVGRMDMNETVTLSGKITGTKEFFMELPCKDPYALRFMVEQGDVIHSGDLLAYEGKGEIISTADGLIREICLGTNSYLRLVSLEDLALECEITDKQAAIFRRNSLSLSDEVGNRLQVLDLSEIYSTNGTLRLLLQYDAESLTYGQPIDNLILYTGKTYTQALVVQKCCIYQKPETGKYYVRLVDENGHFLQEAEVTLGYSNEDYVCISGVEEGVLCDAGYGSLWGNRSNGST